LLVSGSKAMLESLKREKVKVIFGIPGGAIMPFYDVLYGDPDIRHILMRHEQGAAHAADGYARASGGVGVCLATSGPGATNLVTGIATAQMDSSPVVSIAGQVPTAMIGTDAFQEADVFSLMLPITKHNYLIRKAEQVPRVVKMAFEIAVAGRPGPVHVDIPRDVQLEEAEVIYPSGRILDFKDPSAGASSLAKAIKMIAEAERPVIFAGGGIITSGACSEVLMLAELLGAPVVTTLLGKGVVPETHPICLGMIGMHGSRITNRAVIECDLMLAVGVRFDDRATGNVQSFAPKARIIHIDIDASEIGKNVRVDLPIVAGVKETLTSIYKNLAASQEKLKKTVWGERINQLRRELPEEDLNQSQGGSVVTPPLIVRTVMKVLGEDDIVTTEVGQCQMWTAQYLKVRRPRTLITSGGLGTMGFGFPAAIGAKVAKPSSVVVDMAGDGSFLMNCNQLATAVEEDIPVVVVVFNNRYLGMVRQWQELFFGKRYSATYLGETPNFVKLAEAFGGQGWFVERASELEPALREAVKCGKPAVIDVQIPKEYNVFPIIPPGRGLQDMVG